jgi:Co/Zn/Cd efflux system component
MSGCCADGCNKIDPKRAAQLRRVLWTVLALNAALFATEFLIGWWAESSGLQADALDSLADALVYAVTLGVVASTLRAQAGAALLKGGIQAGFGVAVLCAALWRAWGGAEPLAPWMAGTAVGALLVNLACFGLLTRYRNDGVNMRSVWLCSRNDVASNLGVIAAAGLVAGTGSAWPDLAIALLISALFLHTSIDVLRSAWRQWHGAEPTLQPAPPSLRWRHRTSV